MNKNKVAFIICSNNDVMLNECINYLSLLEIPNGIETDLLVIKDAKSMLLGMQEGREATDAKYKVFLHQDVYILNKYFIKDILDIFAANKSIGMIGMVGSPQMPSCGIMWRGKRVGNIYVEPVGETYNEYKYSINRDGATEVDAVDGLLMATSVDVPLRTDLFDGWDFYDVSTSFEYRRKGYKIVVPNQRNPWVLHDDGKILSMWNYGKYCKIAQKEYPDFIRPEKTDIENPEEIEQLLKKKDFDSVGHIEKFLSSPSGRVYMLNDRNCMNIYKLIRIYRFEKEAGGGNVFEKVSSFKEAEEIVNSISFIIYRAAAGLVDDELMNMISEAFDEGISVYAYVSLISDLNTEKENAVLNLETVFDMLQRRIDCIRFLNASLIILPDSANVALRLLEKYLDMGMADEAKKLINRTVLRENEEFAEMLSTEK